MFQPDEEWNEATPQDIPPPTYWPAIVALGITFIFWGLITVLILSAVGLAFFIVGLAGWISELRSALTSNNENESSHGA